MLAATIVNGTVEVREHPDPVPARGQVLVRVHSAGLNRADLLQVAGFYPPPPGYPTDIPGMELAGVVEAVGPGTYRFGVGDRVMAVIGGAQAELVVVDEREAMPVPEGLQLGPAGGVPEAFTTAHDAVFTQAELRSGEHLLVHGAAGGVGTAAVQLGLAAGARVTATVRNAGLRDRVAAYGAAVIDPADTAHHGPYDVVIELVGAVNLAANLEALAIGGRITIIGVGAGATGELNLHQLMTKRGRIHGSTLRARPPEQKADAARRVEAEVLPHLASGRITVPVHATYPLREVADAYAEFAAGGKFGKILVRPDRDG